MAIFSTHFWFQCQRNSINFCVVIQSVTNKHYAYYRKKKLFYNLPHKRFVDFYKKTYNVVLIEFNYIHTKYTKYVHGYSSFNFNSIAFAEKNLIIPNLK